MSKASEKIVILFLILAFSFAYRMLLMHWATFPPGADIGLHNSVIYSITRSGNTDFFWNFYQMGGGLSLTFPGYHIFVAYILLMTGLSDFLAHSLVVSFFSTIVVACSFLITRRVWGASTALIVAFLAAVSRFDIEMLLWGGYPNVVTLMLTPIVFYMFLQKERFTVLPFILSTTLLSSAIYVTHSLSAIIYIITTVALAFFAFILSKRLEISKRHACAWILPLFLGALIVSPFLFKAVPAYLGANREIVVGGVSAIRGALLSTRVLPLEIVVPIFGCVVFFFLFSKEYKGKYLTLPALLFTLWILVPMFFTQGYLVGLFTDYNRFLYFVLLPLTMLIGMGVAHGAGYFSRLAEMYQFFRQHSRTFKETINKDWLRFKGLLTPKNVYASLATAFLIVAFLAVPLFVTPFEAMRVRGFYQVMDEPGYEAIQWAHQNTPVGSVFVSDALYGWWFSGFAQRPTLSAVSPEYLTLSRELAPAENASFLLDTDYVMDNGLIQVREDGGYIGRHNPMFLGKLNWTYFPYPFFNFNSETATVTFTQAGQTKFVDLARVPVTSMHVESIFNETSSNIDSASVTVSKATSIFNYTQVLTVYKDVKFVNMSMTFEDLADDADLISVIYRLETKGVQVSFQGPTVAFLDEGAKVLGQLVFVESQPLQPGPELLYTLNGKGKTEIQLWASVFSISDDPAIYADQELKASFLDGIISGNVGSYQTKEKAPDSQETEDRPLVVFDRSLAVFDYRAALFEWDVSYVAVRDLVLMPKFVKDPAFSLVFINDEVAVFKVKRSLD